LQGKSDGEIASGALKGFLDVRYGTPLPQDRGSRCSITSAAQCRDELMKGFLEKLGETVRDEAQMHRLWYDLRSQSLFEEAFRDDVAEIDKSLEDMVWRIASRFASLGGREPAVSRGALYALFDGLFQRCLLRHLSGARKAVADLQEEVKRLLPSVA